MPHPIMPPSVTGPTQLYPGLCQAITMLPWYLELILYYDLGQYGIYTFPWSWSGNSGLRARSTYRLRHMLLLGERLAQNTSYPKCFWSQYAFSPDIVFFALLTFLCTQYVCRRHLPMSSQLLLCRQKHWGEYKRANIKPLEENNGLQRLNTLKRKQLGELYLQNNRSLG